MQRVARLSPYADLAYGAPVPGATATGVESHFKRYCKEGRTVSPGKGGWARRGLGLERWVET